MATAEPAHQSQRYGSAWIRRYGCAAVSGAMALDAYTGGRVRVNGDAIRARQKDRIKGIGLEDVQTAWRAYGYRLVVSGPGWAGVMSKLRANVGVMIPGWYYAVGAYSSQAGFRDRHMIYVSRVSRPGWLRVYDPLASGPRDWPESVVARFYATWRSAGWGDTTRAGVAPGPVLDRGGRGDVAPPAAGIAAFQARLSALGIPSDPGHRFTAAEAETIARRLYGMTPEHFAWAHTVRFFTGRTVADAAQGQTGSELPGDPDYSGDVPSPADIAAAIGAAVGNVVGHGALLVGLVVLALMGIWLTFREPSRVIVNLRRAVAA